MKTKPHNPLSAFHWREQPSHIDWRGKTERQTLLDATRKNPESTLCLFVPPTRAQRLRKASI